MRVADSTWFEAHYIPLVRVRGEVSPRGAGTVALHPESPDGWYPMGSPVDATITADGPPARVDADYRAGEMSAGTYSFGNRTIVARYLTPPLYEINSTVEGLEFELNGRRWQTPVAFQPSQLPAGSKVSVPEFVEFPQSMDRYGQKPASGGRYRFNGWSDGGEREHEIEVPAGGGSLTLQVQREFELVSRASLGGRAHALGGEIVVSPASEDGFHPAGTQVQLTAVPEAGRYFVGWEHDVSGTETTRSVIMDRDRLAVALFSAAEPVLVPFGEPLPAESLTGRHFVRVPDGTSEVSVRFASSATVRDAEFHVTAGEVRYAGDGYVELGSTRLRESDTITLTRETLSRMRNARLSGSDSRNHLVIRQRAGSAWSGQLHVSIQRDWIGGVWPPAFTFVSSAGWSRPLRQTLRVAPVEGEIPPVRYRIVSDSHWLEAFPPEWTGGQAEIAVTANGAALGAEAYGGKLKILIDRGGDPAEGWTPTGIEIPVHFVVRPPDALDTALEAMEFVPIAAGSFVMGSPEGEQGGIYYERPQHEVRISQGFSMGKYEVTQGEWEAVMGENPSSFKDCGTRCPVEKVSWEDVQEFLRRLNAREWKTGYRYRLPTEAEWEYAARAGTTGARYGALDEIAWYEDNTGDDSGRTTQPVGQKRANAWGLHDMLGNVWEWTADWYGAYASGAVTDPTGPSTGTSRVARGGSAFRHASVARSAARTGQSVWGSYDVGFRLVRTPAGGAEEPTGDGSSGLAGGDDHGDARSAATELAAGAATPGRLERVGDADWFRFRTTAAHTLVTAYTVSDGDTAGELHVAGSDTPLADDDSGSGANFRIVTSVPAGTHYLRVGGFGTPDYALTLEAVADDHGDTRDVATEVAVGASARGGLQVVGDADWFEFRTTAATTWVTAYTVSDGDTAGELHVAGHDSPLADDDSGSGKNFRITASVPAGTHYLRVSGSGTADYTLTLQEMLDAMEFVRIPAGSFVMGSPEDEEGHHNTHERQYEVTISQDFWMGKYEVTQGEWEAVMGSNPSRGRCAQCPVENVSWDDAQEFIRKLNERESGSGHAYRLPTEAEWEYAARAGTTGARHGELDEIAWYRDNSGGTPHPVGQKRANAWGLHDMLGNTWEWTADWFDRYPSGAVTDPTGPSTGRVRVYRGGSRYTRARGVRSAERGSVNPGSRRRVNIFIGIRLVRTN